MTPTTPMVLDDIVTSQTSQQVLESDSLPLTPARQLGRKTQGSVRSTVKKIKKEVQSPILEQVPDLALFEFPQRPWNFDEFVLGLCGINFWFPRQKISDDRRTELNERVHNLIQKVDIHSLGSKSNTPESSEPLAALSSFVNAQNSASLDIPPLPIAPFQIADDLQKPMRHQQLPPTIPLSQLLDRTHQLPKLSSQESTSPGRSSASLTPPIASLFADSGSDTSSPPLQME